jgi:two-component system KDP operon response regulator KdpE
MATQTILLVDDDETLLELLADHMRMSGYKPLKANNGLQGLQVATERDPDLVVLDVMMPGMDGWEVCRRLRQISTVPIILLTAKEKEFDKLRGFRLGVDDYVTKPFSFAELVARVGAVLTRARREGEVGQRLTCGDLTVDFVQHRVTVDGQIVVLTPTEYRLLETLARRPNRTVATEQLLAEVWGSEYQGEYEHVKHYVWALRKKIERDPGDPKHIITERGFGYRLE